MLTHLLIASCRRKDTSAARRGSCGLSNLQGGMATGIQKQHCMRWNRQSYYDHQETEKGIQLERGKQTNGT